MNYVTQTAPNTLPSDSENEEDKETESFAALQGEALAISTNYAIIFLVTSNTNDRKRKRQRICRRSIIFDVYD
jgi:hypothetical protein